MENKEKEIEKVEPVLDEQEEYIEELSENEVLLNEVKELKDKLLRNQAELENFKRRNTEERIKERKYAQQSLLTKLISLQDNFDRAIQSEYKELKELKDGLVMIMNQLSTIFDEEKVVLIESVGKEFDPNYHQAVMTGDDEEYENDIVSEEFQKGYMYKDRMLRPSMVKVNKKGE